MKRATPWLLGALTLVALAIRVRLALSLPLNYDEHWQVFATTVPTPAGFVDELRSVAHPPLFLLLLRLLMWLSPSSMLARLPSVLAGAACIPVGYLCARRMGLSAAAALLAALAVCVAPIHVALSVTVRGYLPALLLLLGAFERFCRLLGDPSDRRALRAFVLLAGAAMWTEYSAMIGVAALGAALLIAAARRRDRALGALAVKLLLRLAPVVVLLGVYLWWSVSLQSYWHTESFLPHDHHYGRFFVHAVTLDVTQLLALPDYLSWLALPLVLWLAWSAWRSEPVRGLAAWGALLTFALLFVLAVVRVYPFGGMPRHQLVLFPFLVLSLAHAVDALISRTRPYLAAVAAAATVTWGVLGLMRPLPEPFGWIDEHRLDAARLSQTVGAHAIYLIPFDAYGFHGALPGARWSPRGSCGRSCTRIDVSTDGGLHLSVIYDPAAWQAPHPPDARFATRLKSLLANDQPVFVYRLLPHQPPTEPLTSGYAAQGLTLVAHEPLAGASLSQITLR